MLPYSDTKAVGAADFYFAINATFRFIREKLGQDALVRYWGDLGRQYFQPVTAQWQAGGLPAVAAYWKAFFAAEPGAEVAVEQLPGEVVLEIRRCPAIRHLREGGRNIETAFCQHCYYVADAMAAPAGFTVRVEGGNGRCRQRFLSRSHPSPQPLSAIADCS